MECVIGEWNGWFCLLGGGARSSGKQFRRANQSESVCRSRRATCSTQPGLVERYPTVWQSLPRSQSRAQHVTRREPSSPTSVHDFRWPAQRWATDVSRQHRAGWLTPSVVSQSVRQPPGITIETVLSQSFVSRKQSDMARNLRHLSFKNLEHFW